EACALGDVTLANAYLSEDASQINSFSADGFTPLTLAAAFCWPEVVRLLMQHGADPSLRANHAFIKVTPLHAAVFGNRTDVVIALLEQ
ncbi:ankyrin repeat domain-containing protein, partial [Acinetobacter baumannii]